MSLADLAGGKGASKGAPALAIAVGPGPDTKTAAARMLKAIHANDAEALEDALRMFCEAHEESKEAAPDGDEG